MLMPIKEGRTGCQGWGRQGPRRWAFPQPAHLESWPCPSFRTRHQTTLGAPHPLQGLAQPCSKQLFQAFLIFHPCSLSCDLVFQ